jgi:mannonate dehydratase
MLCKGYALGDGLLTEAKLLELIENLGPNEDGMTRQRISFREHLNRREVGKIALGGALGGLALGWSRSTSAQEQTSPAAVRAQSSRIHLTLDAPAHPTDEDLLFFEQVGVDRVCARGSKPEDHSAEGLLSIKNTYANAGLMVNDIDNSGVNDNLVDIVLNRPGRDKAIEDYKAWIHTLGQVGFYQLKATYDAVSGVRSGVAETRGVHDRDVDLNSSELTGSRMSIKGSANSLLFGREYGPDEIWENYTHFIKQIAPVAEKAGVAIGLQPNDPPYPSLFGVARIFSTFEDCKRALRIANSPNVGMSLACGPWLEGGSAMGIDPTGAIRYLVSQKQLFEVHFRGTSSALPHFHETFVDDAYYDLYKIMKALVDVKYDGVVTLDHLVPMVGGPRTYEAFGLGYLRAMLQCAQRGYHA